MHSGQGPLIPVNSQREERMVGKETLQWHLLPPGQQSRRISSHGSKYKWLPGSQLERLEDIATSPMSYKLPATS